MGKYLHRYETFDEFQKDYNDEEGVIIEFVCSAGTFTYDRYGSVPGDSAYFWKNGDKELVTPWRNPQVGAWNYNSGTGAYDVDNGTGVEITAIGEKAPGKYHEPWVSYTTYTINTEISGDLFAAYDEGSYRGKAVLKYKGLGKAKREYCV